MRFGFIAFCGKLPRGTSGYLENIFLLNLGSNFVARLESLKPGCKSPIIKDILFKKYFSPNY